MNTFLVSYTQLISVLSPNILRSGDQTTKGSIREALLQSQSAIPLISGTCLPRVFQSQGVPSILVGFIVSNEGLSLATAAKCLFHTHLATFTLPSTPDN